MNKTYLTISCIAVSQKSLIVLRNRVWGNIEWFVKKFKIRNNMTDMNFHFLINLTLPPKILKFS